MDESSQSDNSVDLQRRDRLKSSWQATLKPLHKCQMSTKYRNAMVSTTGQKTWEFDRDTDFAMSILLPGTIDLLTTCHKPSIDDIRKIPWVDTKQPGVYSILAWTVDADGNIDQAMLKVGCAWSEDGGLRVRGRQLKDDKSIRAANQGSPFHTFYQDTKASGREIFVHKSTLAIGERFVRRPEGDEYLAGRYYQVESMLAAALGSSIPTMENPKYLDLQAWPYVDDELDFEWAGANSHCAMEDNWAAPPSGKAGKDTLCCPIDGCYKNKPGEHNFNNVRDFNQHLEAHQKGTVETAPRKPYQPFRKCSDRRCRFMNHTFELNKHEPQHIDGEFACGACGLLFRWSRDCEQHVLECLVENAIDLHKAAWAAKKLANKLVCGDHRCGYETKNDKAGRATMVKHRNMHIDGSYVCVDCGIRLSTGGVMTHKRNWCPGRSAATIAEQSMYDLVCNDPRCKALYKNALRDALIFQHYVAHIQSHIDGGYTCEDCGLRMRDPRMRADHFRTTCPREMPSTEELAQFEKQHRETLLNPRIPSTQLLEKQHNRELRSTQPLMEQQHHKLPSVKHLIQPLKMQHQHHKLPSTEESTQHPMEKPRRELPSTEPPKKKQRRSE